MDYNFKLEVSHLADKVKKHNLLFYPAMIHILISVLKRRYKDSVYALCPVYSIILSDGNTIMSWNEYQDNFLCFFENYVKNCYNHMLNKFDEKDAIIPPQGVLISTQPSTEDYILANKYPEFYLSSFEKQNGKIWQTILIKSQDEFENIECFAKDCQRMCDMFQEKF